MTQLLLNILPENIVTELQLQDPNMRQKCISAKYEEVTVLFADLVGFTELSSRLPAARVVTMLNDIFSTLDLLVEKYQMEKIKTIGGEQMQISI